MKIQFVKDQLYAKVMIKMRNRKFHSEKCRVWLKNSIIM